MQASLKHTPVDVHLFFNGLFARDALAEVVCKPALLLLVAASPLIACLCVQVTRKVVEEAGQQALLLPGDLADDEHLKCAAPSVIRLAFLACAPVAVRQSPAWPFMWARAWCGVSDVVAYLEHWALFMALRTFAGRW